MSNARSPDTEVAFRLREVLATAVDTKRIAGGEVIVALKGEIIAHEVFGYSNLGRSVPMAIGERFRLASVTKPIVSLAAIKLVADGELSLHEPITRWLPYFRPSLAGGSVPPITLHHLLTHTSGLSYGFQEPPGGEYDELGISDGLNCSGLSLEDNLRRLSAANLKFEPGSAWRYSLALDVTGAIIEKVTGIALPKAVEELVSRPLGLRSFDFNVPEETSLAVAYVDSSGTLQEMGDKAEVVPPDGVNAIRFSPRRAFAQREFPSGGAGMVGTGMDVLSVLEVLRKDGVGFIGEDWARMMVQPHVDAELRGQGDGWGFGYMGAVLMDPTVMKTPQHPGTVEWGGVYGHNWFIDGAAGISVVSLTNTTWEGVGGCFPQKVRDAVYLGVA
ncbi:serine hydrolase domain-containing protein [Paraburkholderia bannensis]|uniref:serine hydrolase domain-containing protein n=1 Tax=Paraburkholderia bannensis TaxID=765414 RepID=UPI002AC34E20|nr:serine hydrolase domain-containing protein [Paraburkholderia bannensis]